TVACVQMQPQPEPPPAPRGGRRLPAFEQTVPDRVPEQGIAPGGIDPVRAALVIDDLAAHAVKPMRYFPGGPKHEAGRRGAAELMDRIARERTQGGGRKLRQQPLPVRAALETVHRTSGHRFQTYDGAIRQATARQRGRLLDESPDGREQDDARQDSC